MDSDVVKLLLTALLTFGIFLYDSYKKKKAKEKRVAARHASAVSAGEHVARSHPEVRPATAAACPAPLRSGLPEEGGPRVHAAEDASPAAPPSPDTTKEAPDTARADLRRAIVWGEIMQPKFRQ